MNDHHKYDHQEPNELISIPVAGLPAQEWARLQQKIFGLIDTLTEKVQDLTDLNQTGANTVATAAKWAEAKIEKPSLENEKLRAEITFKYAEAKTKLAEEQKIYEETFGLKIDNRMKQLTGMLDTLERTLEFMNKVNGAAITFAQIGQDGHLLIGPQASGLRLPPPSDPESETEDPEKEKKS